MKINFTGRDRIRFLNLCKNNHLKVWNVCTYDDSDKITFLTSLSAFYEMRGIRKKCSGRLKIDEKKGLVFLLKKYRKRIFFAAGLAVFFVLIKLISLYIWDISFDGNYSYTDIELMNFLEENHIHNGLKKKNINCDHIEFLLRKKYNDITWVSAELKGTRLIIHIKENFDTNIAKIEDTPYNIISNVNGVVDSIITSSGVPLVKSGDEITEGQVLVSGSVALLNDAKEVTGYEFVNSDADIYACLIQPYQETFELTHDQKLYTGRKNTALAVELFGRKLCFSGFSKKLGDYDVIKDYKNITLTKNYYLPFSVCKMSFKEYKTESFKYTEEEARQLAEEKMNHYIDKLQEKGIQIIENNVTIGVYENKCVISGDFIIRQKIGKIEYIDADTMNQPLEDGNK